MPCPGTRAETDITKKHIVWVELATVAAGGGHPRPLLSLSRGATVGALRRSGLAYLCADRVLGWIAQRYGISIPQEAEPVIVALIFGVLTDYLVFFVSGYRQRLRGGN